MAGRERFIRITPQTFIHGPYEDCPKCKAEASFGVLSIGPDSYSRRCTKCLDRVTFVLPKLSRKLIYLDQLAISNLMMAINPNSRAYREGRVDPFWRELFAVLDRLRSLQLIACSESEFHRQESAVAPFRPDLRYLYEHLSAGVSFADAISIHRFQITEQVSKWAINEDTRAVDLHRDLVVRGGASAWTDVVRVSVDVGDPDGYIEELRKSRGEGEAVIRAIFERWQTEGKAGKTFRDFFAEEARGWIRAAIPQYREHLLRLERVRRGEEPYRVELAFPPEYVDIVMAIKHGLDRAGVPGEQLWPKIHEYVDSEAVEWLPFARLAASLWATVAAQAKDRANPPDRGLGNDVRMISSLLPYCDAMFVDRECHGLLANIPVSHRPRYGCEVFSFTNRDKFLVYLREIEAGASAEHLAQVAEVYGDRVEKTSVLFKRAD